MKEKGRSLRYFAELIDDKHKERGQRHDDGNNESLVLLAQTRKCHVCITARVSVPGNTLRIGVNARTEVETI